MDRRLRLQEILEEVLGSSNVYFQPPPNVQMKYPAIVYNRESADTRFADNTPYGYVRRYEVTVMDRNPDSEIVHRVTQLPLCTHNRSFAVNGLNHDVFTLYF